MMTSLAVEPKVEQLLAVLDEDVRHLEATLSELDTLRRLLIKRDDAALDRLLGEIRGRTEAYAANEQRRQVLRSELALALGCTKGRFTLSRLQDMLPDPQRAAVEARQKRLKSLVAELRREHTLTVALVSDSARFNRALMKALFGSSGRADVTYDTNGVSRGPASATLMSLRL